VPAEVPAWRQPYRVPAVLGIVARVEDVIQAYDHDCWSRSRGGRLHTDSYPAASLAAARKKSDHYCEVFLRRGWIPQGIVLRPVALRHGDPAKVDAVIQWAYQRAMPVYILRGGRDLTPYDPRIVARKAARRARRTARRVADPQVWTRRLRHDAPVWPAARYTHTPDTTWYAGSIPVDTMPAIDGRERYRWRYGYCHVTDRYDPAYQIPQYPGNPIPDAAWMDGPYWRAPWVWSRVGQAVRKACPAPGRKIFKINPNHQEVIACLLGI